MAYHELIHSVDRAADMFWQSGTRPRDTVAIVLRNSLEFIIAYFALAKIGAVAVPINYMVSKEDEICYILENAKCKGVVTAKEFLPAYKGAKRRLDSLKFLIAADSAGEHDVVDFWQHLKHARYHYQTRHVPVGEHDVVSILYTSGTTGHPKGVLLTHHNLIENAKASIQAMEPVKKDVFMALLPCSTLFRGRETS